MNALGFAQAGATGAGIGNRESQRRISTLGALVSVLFRFPIPMTTGTFTIARFYIASPST